MPRTPRTWLVVQVDGVMPYTPHRVKNDDRTITETKRFKNAAVRAEVLASLVPMNAQYAELTNHALRDPPLLAAALASDGLEPVSKLLVRALEWVRWDYRLHTGILSANQKPPVARDE